MRETLRTGPNTVSGRSADEDEAWICRMLREVTRDPVLDWWRARVEESPRVSREAA